MAKSPSLDGIPSIEFLEVDWPKLKTRFGSLPTGIKIPFRFLVTATIAGKLECACSEEPDCKTVSARKFSVPVVITVPVPMEIFGLLLRFVPIAGWIYTGAHITYVVAKITKKLYDVSWAFKPAIRVVRESADLICEGRFDPSVLLQHVLDIASTVDL